MTTKKRSLEFHDGDGEHTIVHSPVSYTPPVSPSTEKRLKGKGSRGSRASLQSTNSAQRYRDDHGSRKNSFRDERENGWSSTPTGSPPRSGDDYKNERGRGRESPLDFEYNGQEHGRESPKEREREFPMDFSFYAGQEQERQEGEQRMRREQKLDQGQDQDQDQDQGQGQSSPRFQSYSPEFEPPPPPTSPQKQSQTQTQDHEQDHDSSPPPTMTQTQSQAQEPSRSPHYNRGFTDPRTPTPEPELTPEPTSAQPFRVSATPFGPHTPSPPPVSPPKQPTSPSPVPKTQDKPQTPPAPQNKPSTPPVSPAPQQAQEQEPPAPATPPESTPQIDDLLMQLPPYDWASFLLRFTTMLQSVGDEKERIARELDMWNWMYEIWSTSRDRDDTRRLSREMATMVQWTKMKEEELERAREQHTESMLAISSVLGIMPKGGLASPGRRV